MAYEYLKLILKYLHRYQWRIWAGLIVLIFSIGLLVRWLPSSLTETAVQVVSTSTSPSPATSQLELADSTISAPEARIKPAPSPLTLPQTVESGMPQEPTAPVAPSSVPEPELPAISVSEPTDSEPSVPSVASTPTPIQSPSPTSGKTTTGKTYIVQPGDSLWKLAEEWFDDGYAYVNIARANDLPINSWLEVGQELRMPAGPSVTESAWSSSDPSNVPQASETISTPAEPTLDTSATVSSIPNTQPYSIQVGDSLWLIAEQELGSGYRWVEIYRLNKKRIGANPGLIYPHTQILVPTSTP